MKKLTGAPEENELIKLHRVVNKTIDQMKYIVGNNFDGTLLRNTWTRGFEEQMYKPVSAN